MRKSTEAQKPTRSDQFKKTFKTDQQIDIAVEPIDGICQRIPSRVHLRVEMSFFFFAWRTARLLHDCFPQLFIWRGRGGGGGQGQGSRDGGTGDRGQGTGGKGGRRGGRLLFTLHGECEYPLGRRTRRLVSWRGSGVLTPLVHGRDEMPWVSAAVP